MKRKKKRKNRKDAVSKPEAEVKKQPESKTTEAVVPVRATTKPFVPDKFKHVYGICKCFEKYDNNKFATGDFGESLFDDYYDQLKSVELDLYDEPASILPRYSTYTDQEEIDKVQNAFDMFTAVEPYTIKRLIGYGKHGVIYKVEKDNMEYVAKLARRRSFTRMTINEYIKIKDTEHENIVKFSEIVKCGFIMELLPSTLKKAIECGHMQSGIKLEISGGILKGLEYLHDNGIAHLDIKPSNVLLDHSNTPKLADFGISKRFMTASGRVKKLYSRCGTVPYMCPELVIFYLQQRRYAVDMMSADMWSCGCTLFELLTKQLPFGSPKYEELLEKQKANQLHLPGKIRRLLRTDDDTRDLLAIIKYLLAYDPYLRATTKTIISKYFTKP